MLVALLVLLAAPPSPELQKLLDSPDSHIRERAAFVAGRMADVDNSSELSQVLLRVENGKPETRAASLLALSLRTYGEKGAPASVQRAALDGLHDRNLRVATAAAEAIGYLRPPGAVQGLITALEGEKSKPRGVEFRRAVLTAVVRVGDPRLGKPLFDLYRTAAGGDARLFPIQASPEGLFLTAAADSALPVALEVVNRSHQVLKAGPDGKLEPVEGSALITDRGMVHITIRGNEQLRVWTARAMVTLDVRPQMALGYMEKNVRAARPETRRETVHALASLPTGKFRDRGLQAVAARREDPIGSVRAAVVRVLAAPGAGKSANALIDAVDDPFPDLRAEAVLGLADAGLVPLHREKLQAALKAEKDPIVKAAIASALD